MRAYRRKTGLKMLIARNVDEKIPFHSTGIKA